MRTLEFKFCVVCCAFSVKSGGCLVSGTERDAASGCGTLSGVVLSLLTPLASARVAAAMSCPTGSGFEPSGAVEAFHGIPHSDIDLQSSPDQFEPDNSQYWEVSGGLGHALGAVASCMVCAGRVCCLSKSRGSSCKLDLCVCV